MFKRKPVSKGDWIYRYSIRLFLIGTLLVAVCVFAWTWVWGIESMKRGIEAMKPWLAIWRFLLFVGVIGGWRLWASWLAHWAYLDESRYQSILDQRWRVALWLVVIEMVLVQGVSAQFFGNLLN